MEKLTPFATHGAPPKRGTFRLLVRCWVLRTSENPLRPKFAERPFHEVE